MNILLIGGAGHVGSIIRPALESHHTCFHYDIRPVPGVTSAAEGGRGFVASIDDDVTLRHALNGIDAIVNLAMGDLSRVEPIFDINVRGFYRVILAAQASGVRRIVNAGSVSVFRGVGRRDAIDESTPPDAWNDYGVSKRLAESICEIATQADPNLGIVTLRLLKPADEATYANRQPVPFIDARGIERNWCYLGPKDTGRLFLTALEYTTNPGHHIFHGAGEVVPRWFPCHKAAEKLDWRPRGE